MFRCQGFVLWSALAVIAPGVLLHCRALSLGGRKVSQLGHASHRHPSCLATGRKQEPVMDRRLSLLVRRKEQIRRRDSIPSTSNIWVDVF